MQDIVPLFSNNYDINVKVNYIRYGDIIWSLCHLFESSWQYGTIICSILYNQCVL